MRDLDENPYSAEETRVAAFLGERGVGGGDDPVGFILASYAHLVHERNELRQDVLDREEGRLSLVLALVDVAKSETLEAAVERARRQLLGAGVNVEMAPARSEFSWDISE